MDKALLYEILSYLRYSGALSNGSGIMLVKRLEKMLKEME